MICDIQWRFRFCDIQWRAGRGPAGGYPPAPRGGFTISVIFVKCYVPTKQMRNSSFSLHGAHTKTVTKDLQKNLKNNKKT